ncbi:hypothetical protein ABW19_dt0210604 [Dactylella cylindrospora]|nr:hypothetical protein ABW19_dt0210604 [Dactylella cylindrospora]
MARRVPRQSYAQGSTSTARSNKDEPQDDQEDLYSDPFANNQQRQISSTPAPQSHNSSFNSSPVPSSDKENTPQQLRHAAGGSPHVIKKEKGLIAKESRTSPYDMPPKTSRASRGSPLMESTSNASSSRVSKARSTTMTPRSHASRVASRPESAASSRKSRASRTMSREDSVVSRTIGPESEAEDEEEEADEDEELADASPEPEDAAHDDAESDHTPEPTQLSRISETPAPSRPPPSQLPSASQPPSASQRMPGSQYYDPHQSQTERRRVKVEYNKMQQELIDNKQRFLKAGNIELLSYIDRAANLFTDVKQTSVAMVDGKIQVEIGKIAAEKARMVGNSNTNTGLDIDEFIAKTIQWMSKTRPPDNSVGHNWESLGEIVVAPSLKRACPSDFMLGPMAIQKRQRIIKERRKVVRRKPEEFVRPIALDEQQIAKNENSTTKNVRHISECLEEYVIENDCEETGVNYFKFIINPHSFSQTIENMFYLAFLVRDGRVAIAESEDGLPYLIPALAPSPEEAQEQQIVRKQIVMPMDKQVWRELIEVFQITDSAVPTREREREAINASGWYS